MKMYNPTEAELDLILTRPGYRIVGEPASPPVVPAFHPSPTPLPAPVPAYKSKTETRYAQYLDMQHSLGHITTWAYEPLRLWLTPGMRYTPDFCVQKGDSNDFIFIPGMPVTLSPDFAASLSHLDGIVLTCIEVKASVSHVFEPSRALDRVKMAASLYPMFGFIVVQWDRKRHDWTERTL